MGEEITWALGDRPLEPEMDLEKMNDRSFIITTTIFPLKKLYIYMLPCFLSRGSHLSKRKLKCSQFLTHVKRSIMLRLTSVQNITYYIDKQLA